MVVIVFGAAWRKATRGDLPAGGRGKIRCHDYARQPSERSASGPEPAPETDPRLTRVTPIMLV
jgi:hypothetical protein